MMRVKPRGSHKHAVRALRLEITFRALWPHLSFPGLGIFKLSLSLQHLALVSRTWILQQLCTVKGVLNESINLVPSLLFSCKN